MTSARAVAVAVLGAEGVQLPRGGRLLQGPPWVEPVGLAGGPLRHAWSQKLISEMGSDIIGWEG